MKPMVPPWIRKSPVLPWIVLFFALAFAVTQYGGTNAKSRIAALRAITEQGTLSIDAYKEWTFDWSLSPNGHYYSNKAPGAALLSLPVFAVLDFPLQWFSKAPRDEKGRLPEPGYLQLSILVLLTQIFPMALLVLAMCLYLQKMGAPTESLHFFALAALFGNTAAFYFNCFFGHSFAAWLFLGGVFFWTQKKYALASLLVFSCALSDYGGIFSIPFFFLCTLARERSFRPIIPLALGGGPIVVLWAWFHWVAFGSPFALASSFINPDQMHALPDTNGLVYFSPIPQWWILEKLLWSPERGLAFTQPWVLLAVFWSFFQAWRSAQNRFLHIWVLGGFLGLLWMNAGFGGWHGGWTLGPRYLSLALPAFAFLLAMEWQKIPKIVFPLLWGALTMALVFRLWAFPFSNLAPTENLWTYHWKLYQEAERLTPFVRLVLAVALCFSAAIWAWRRRLFQSPA